jgi:hypothetical protein
MDAFVGFSRIFLMEILIFKGLTARRPGVKGLILFDTNYQAAERKPTVKELVSSEI